MERIHLGELIRRKRIARGMDVASLAEACDVNLVTIYRIERGGSTPMLWLFARIIQALDWDPADAVSVAAQERR